MGKKADLVAAIQKEAERFEQLTGELGSQLNGFPKMKPFPREHNAQPYFESYYRECAGPAEQISNTWEAASTSHQNVARDVAALEKLLKAQKSNLFKKYSKGY
ncbi:MAG TPA: hypothetical protein VGE52_05895, partial [Pirellulales bacterium]